jgi:hypothetical protein
MVIGSTVHGQFTETKPTNIMLKSLFNISLASIALAGVATAGTVTAVNFADTFTQVQANGVPVSGGFLAVGTSSLTDAQIGDLFGGTSASDLENSFTQFGASSSFGGAPVNSLAGYFSMTPNGEGGAAAFSGNEIFLIGGNASTIALSTALFVLRSDDVFGADAPLFSATITLNNSNVLLGAPGGTNTLDAGFPAFQMAAGIVPEPGVSILALFSVGLLVLRRRRR